MVSRKNIYCFISDENKKFYRAKQMAGGDYVISYNSQPYPISFNPSNLLNTQIEFATNSTYFSMARSINYPLDFIKDGAAILRNFYYNGKGVEQKCYLTIVQWNGVKNIYELAYYGRFDLGQKKEDPKSGMFSVPCIDDSVWGVLSQHDDVEYAIECNATNPDAIRVLVDSITLVNNYTFQTVQAPITHFADGDGLGQYIAMPFVLINQDGDSAGLAVQSQNSTPIEINGTGGWHIVNKQIGGFFFLTQYALDNVKISGNITFEWSSDDDFGGGSIMIVSNQKSYPITGSFAFGNIIADFSKGLIKGKKYSYDFSFTLDLNADERLFLILNTNSSNTNHFTITPIISNTIVNVKTKAQPQIVYGLRAIDYLKQLSLKATNNRYSVNSSFFVENNKDVITSGDAIRGVPDAKIYGSFKDFFQTFDPLDFMALRSINDSLWMEKAVDVYNSNSTLVDIGEAINIELEAATDYYGNEIQVGGPNQDYRHPSGRLEFNQTNTFSLNVLSINKKISWITKYRTGCYDIMFLILDYQGGSSQDNSGDKNVYLLNISDETGSARDDIETFENITFDVAPLEPIIKSPLSNDVISNNKPVVRGIAPAGSNVNVYADTVLDGNTIADSSGNWSYVLVNALSPYVQDVTTGAHVIQASYTDLAAPNSSVNVLIDTSFSQETLFTYPSNLDNLYNNLPLVKGVAQFGTPVQLKLDGVLISTITADESCKWEYKFIVPIPNGSHTLDANGQLVNITVDTEVEHPLITYVGSELDGFPVINSLPLIKGVAKAGTQVDLWLNYISYNQLNFDNSTNTRITVQANSTGNWSFQVVPVSYNDPVTGIPVVMTPIPNGLSVISTSLINYTVGIVQTGYKLNRPNFTSITGVTDNTVFNVAYSPKRMLINHAPMISSIMDKQRNEYLYFQKEGKNANLVTVLDGVTISERGDVPVSSLGNPIARLEYGVIKTKTSKTFANILRDFSNGGVIKTTYRGTDLFFLPIGSMKISNISSDVQEWKLLMSPLTSYMSLLNLYKNGLTLTINKNSMYHSDRNTLHFVKYGFILSNKYNFKEIYDDWFSNRNSAWILNPEYIQKIQTDEVTKDQIIVNGISDITIHIFRCSDAIEVDSIPYVVSSPAPLNPPNRVMEAEIDWSNYPEGQYFTILFAGVTPVAIGERIQTKSKWYNTILIESSNSENDVSFFYSTGIKTVLRVEGIVKKLQPEIVTIVANEESGDSEILYAQNTRKRVIRFGTAYGLPDYLYLKIADALTNDNCYIENVAYTLDKDEKINPSDDVEGHPLYYYNVNMTLKENSKGISFETPGEDSSVILVVDGLAIGLPPESLFNIELDED
jgi:hypothetical protein